MNQKHQAIRIFWAVYLLFLLTTYLSRHVFGLIFIGPAFAIVYALVALTSFIPYAQFLKHFKAAAYDPLHRRKNLRKAWVALFFSLPLKLAFICINVMEYLQPTSNHWNFG